MPWEKRRKSKALDFDVKLAFLYSIILNCNDQLMAEEKKSGKINTTFLGHYNKKYV